ncbi:hypothetical protein jaqu_14430 [Jannaschia aquimarina]|uniref:Uncharacterized protein n=1 Tax=Jannaschia aquimarina TaxID=935700 RepID=A0A0D1EH13_9RHOB|nr:hypothetical protein jaqu_14430 [Jannaschia aquimarina]SNT11057.1 hypothetical protein SAMN05421775_1065 [Jannaschia aquimarina]
MTCTAKTGLVAFLSAAGEAGPGTGWGAAPLAIRQTAA